MHLIHRIIAVTLLSGLGLFTTTTHAEQDPDFRWVAPWDLSGPLVLVWPEHIAGHRDLVPLYVELIQALPDDLPVGVISPRPPSASHLEEMGRDIRYLPMATVRDVRLRDWGGQSAVLPNGRLVLSKATYAPRNLRGRAAARAQDDHQAGRALGELLYGDTYEVPLVMAGTSLTHNGAGTAIASNRIISENEHRSLRSIRKKLYTHGGIDRLIFVPVHPGDTRGRLDDVVRFISEDTVVLSLPPAGDEAGRRYHDALREQLAAELGEAFHIVSLPQSGDSRLGDIQGNYLHFIQAGRRIWLPAFGTESDETAEQLLRAALPEQDIIPLPLSAWDVLAEEDAPPGRIAVLY